jgi:hypothetical protein
MAKRAHFTDNDIDVFLNDTNWEKTFNKRIENWKVARFPYEKTLVQQLFNQVASYKKSNVIFTELLNKLDAAGYPFEQSEFLPGTMHVGSLDNHFAETYIQLFTFIEQKGFSLNKTLKSQMFEMFKETFNPKLINFLESKGIVVSWSNVERLVRGLRMKATSNFMDMGAISKSPLGRLMLNPEAQSPDKQLNKRFLDSLEESDTQENVELNFILDYLNKNQLNNKQIKDLERSLIPPQIRLQQRLLAANGSVDPFQMMQVGMDKNVKPRDWFNESQLKVIDLVQFKYGLKIVK